MIKIRRRAASGGLSCILAQMGLIPSAGGSLPKDISEWKEFKKSGILHIMELYLSPSREVRGSVKGLSAKKNLVWDLPVTEAGEKCWMMDSSQ